MKKQFHIKGTEKPNNKWGYELVVDDNGEISTISMESPLHPTEFLMYSKLQQQLGLWLGSEVPSQLPINNPPPKPKSTYSPIRKNKGKVPLPVIPNLSMSIPAYGKSLWLIPIAVPPINWNPYTTENVDIKRCREQLIRGSWVGYCSRIVTNNYGIEAPKLKSLINQIKVHDGTSHNWISIYYKLVMMSDSQFNELDATTANYYLNKLYNRKQAAIEEADAILGTLSLPVPLQVPAPSLNVDWLTFVKSMFRAHTEHEICELIDIVTPGERTNLSSKGVMIRELNKILGGKGIHPLGYTTWSTALYRLYRIGRLTDTPIPTFP